MLAYGVYIPILIYLTFCLKSKELVLLLTSLLARDIKEESSAYHPLTAILPGLPKGSGMTTLYQNFLQERLALRMQNFLFEV